MTESTTNKPAEDHVGVLGEEQPAGDRLKHVEPLERGEVAVLEPRDLHPVMTVAVVVDRDELVQVLLELAPGAERLEADPADESSSLVDGSTFETGPVAKRLVCRLETVVPAFNYAAVHGASGAGGHEVNAPVDQ